MSERLGGRLLVVKPNISIVIPAHRRPAMLQEAVLSCREASGGCDFEVIVVNDGGSSAVESALAEVSSMPVRHIPQDHQGAPAARNKGLEAAEGEYIKFLDDDDLLTESSLLEELRELRSHDADLIGGRINIEMRAPDVVRSIPAPDPPDPLVDLLARRSSTHPLRFTASRGLLSELRWDEAYDCEQDFEFFIKVAARAKKYICCESAVGHMRAHEGPRVGYRGRGGRGNRKRLRILLDIGERILEGEVEATPERIKAARIGIWKEVHVLTGFGWEDLAERAWDMIERLTTGTFLPPRKRGWLRPLDRVLGARAVERTLAPVRSRISR